MDQIKLWIQQLLHMLQSPQDGLSMIIGFAVLAVIALVAGLLTRKLLSLAVIALFVYALLIYGDDIRIWFARTF